MEREEAVQQGLDSISEALGKAYDAGRESAPVVEDVTPYGEAEVAERAAAAADAARAEQKQVDEEVLAAAKAELSAKISELELEIGQKDADALEETIADQLAALAQQLRDRTVAAPAPAPEPVEPPVPDAQGSTSVGGSDINEPSQV